MSFFGFDASGHNKAAPGFSQAHDPFAGLRGSNADALEFEDTYDGLGDQLDETDDAFNDDTFGGGSSNVVKVGKDFDFFGQTAKVADAIEEEHVRFTRQHPAPKPAPPVRPTPAYQFPSQPAPKPARSGYEKYKDSEPVPELQADAALWGVAPKKQAAAAAAQAPAAPAPSSARKIMSLEEVEAAMRAQTRTSVPPEPSPIPVHQEAQPHVIQHPSAPQQQTDLLHGQQQHIPQPAPSPSAYGQPQDGLASQSVPQMTILQRPQSKHSPVPGVRPAHAPSATTHQHQQQHQNQQQQHRQALDQRQAPGPHQHQPTQQHAAASVKPTQILQNPNRLSGDANRIGMVGSVFPPHPTQHRQQGSFSHPAIVTHSSQLSQFSEEEKSAYLEQEARRAKRNHKIFMLSKDNGLMTPQDKNFITRIQLQQLVAATGNPIEQATDDNIAEDFYYQVHNQIRGSQRQHPGQPLSNFAQTYLYQTGSRQTGARRQQRGPENHVQRMEQQVQRAVEAAKNKPKNKQLIIEGSLGKISFSNAKTPKPLLNIKRADSSPDINRRPGSAGGGHPQSAVVDPKAVLGDVEKVYDTLMEMEDHDRKMPPPGSESTDPELAQRRSEWAQRAEQLNARLWRELKVHEPLGATLVHPFIAFLSCGKGKKAIPRVFRHTTHEQRTTILTMIVVHLDQLDIVRGAQSETGDTRLNAALREKIDLFSVAVMGTLFNFMSELGLDIVTGVLGLISTLNVDLIARTRIGASMLTMILSRAEILKQAGTEQNQLESWTSTYNNFFNLLEPTLPRLFPGPVNSGQDIYVWQLLAALGIGANQDQQQRLVLGVKDRVMDTVALSKTLPQEMAQPRLQNVNLFMRSIGLDVELLV